MISFHTKINGQDFEIEVADGLTLEMTDNKLTVKGTPKLNSAQPDVHYHYHYGSGLYQPYWNQQIPITVNPPHPLVGPTVTYGTVSSSVPNEQNISNICQHNLLPSTIKN